MRKIKNTYGAAMVVLTLLLSQSAFAQNNERLVNPASIELLKAKSLWFNTTNAAGLSLDKMDNYNNLIIKYNFKNGDFKTKPEGENERLIGVSTEGGLNLGGGYVWGEFSYNNEKLQNTQFNTTMLDLSRKMPFYTVDKNVSDFNRQDYNLHMKVSSKPLFGRYLVGLEAGYYTKTGAKQLDPRSETNFYTINAIPSIVAVFNKHVVGLNFEYQRLDQQSLCTNSNSQLNQDVWVMRGLGNSYTAVVGGLQSLGKFLYEGNKIGGGVQYSFVGESVSLLFNGKYSFGVEDVVSSPTKPKKEGTVKEDCYEGSLQVLLKGDNIQKAEFSYSNDDLKGIEYVQVIDNSVNVQKWIVKYQSVRSKFATKNATFKYDFFRGNKTDYNWRAGLSANYRNSDDLYIIPESTLKLEDMILGINGKANICLGKYGKLLPGVAFNYKYNMSGDYVYGGANPTSDLIVDYMTPDFQYRQRDYCKFGGELTYVTKIDKVKNIGLYIKAAVDYYKPTEGSDNRLLTDISVGFNF